MSASASSAVALVEPLTTARSLSGPFDYRIPEELRAELQVGSMLVVPFGRRRVLGVVVGLAASSELPQERLQEPLRALELGVPADLVALAGWLAREYCSTFARALALFLPPEATRRLSGRARGRPRRAPEHASVGARMPSPPQLTEDQRRALDPLLAAIADGRGGRHLLHGVTGSGKTEIYLRAAAAALDRGHGAIVLVPEIALTPQIVARFLERFGETVAVLHSRLTPAQRYAEWRRLREGAARVCVGPRSAIFAPIERLGLVVVDEEHDASYKNEGDPRYDAREVATERATRSSALLVFGSATPRPESVHRLQTRLLPRRVDGRPLPPVEVLDMRGARGGLHPASLEALAEVRAAGGKAIVLLNRRGWANFLSCRSCGEVWGCPGCDVALVLHRLGGYLACHHCGHREQVPDGCRVCGSSAVARHGAGTERLQSDLEDAFDDGRFPVFRLDGDVAGSAGTTGELLERFDRAPSGVLIGTQMVAKGHDFPRVALGLVLDADSTLRFPDFRAEERTFALIAQLAGRIGRGGEGRVLVQTIAPEARAIAHAAGHDTAGFLAGELERRRALAYPPFSHLVRIVCSAEREDAARRSARAIAERLATLPDHARTLGPAPLFKLRGRERQVLVVKAERRAAAVEAIGRAVQEVAAAERAGVTFSVDVEPQ